MNEKKARIIRYGSEVLSEIPACAAGNQTPFTLAVSCLPLVMNATYLTVLIHLSAKFSAGENSSEINAVILM